MIRDRNIQWKRKKIHVNIIDFSSVLGEAAAVNTGLAAGVNITQEISTFNLAGFLHDTDLDAMSHYMVVPYDMDANEEIGFRLLWNSGSATIADTVQWDIKVDFLAAGATLIAATTVLDTMLAIANPTATAYQSQWTSRGIKNAGALTQAQVDAGALMTILVILTDLVSITEDIFPLTLEMDYAVRACDAVPLP